MSKADFTADEFDGRLARVRKVIGEAGLDWLVAFHPVSIHWLTGSDAKSYQGLQCLFVSTKPGPLTVLTREGERNEYQDDVRVDRIETWGGCEPEDPVEVFRKVATGLGLLKARVGIEVPAYYLHPHHYVRIKDMLGQALVAEPTNLINDLKLVKSPAELAYIRAASRIADKAAHVFAGALKEGRSELAVAGDVYQALLSAGSGLAASTLNLVAGERSAFSHGAPTERKLQRGDFGQVEYGAAYRRYTVTIGRQFCIGPPTARMRELFDLVRRAADACIAKMRAGVPAIEPHLAAKKVIADAGLDRYRIHTSGYGLAPAFPPSWGEPIHMFGGTRYTLEAGMVLSVEPPVFIGEERLGARLIDNVLVTKDGAELLSRHPRDLIVVD